MSEPGHGIPSVTEINKNGWRQQDKAYLLKTQMVAESAKVASLTREKITVDMVTKLACTTSLSNDRVLQLGDDQLQLRIKIVEMSNQKFWMDMAIPHGTCPRYIMKTAWKAFPHFHQLVYGKIDVQPDRTKVKVMSNIDEYLRKSKCTSKSICEYLYSINGSQKAVPKREPMFGPGDILDIFKFFRVIEVKGTEDECKTAALAITSSFECMS